MTPSPKSHCHELTGIVFVYDNPLKLNNVHPIAESLIRTESIFGLNKMVSGKIRRLNKTTPFWPGVAPYGLLLSVVNTPLAPPLFTFVRLAGKELDFKTR